MGLSGTFIARNLIASTGLIHTGIMATTFQAAVLCTAAAIYNFKLAPAAFIQVRVFQCHLLGRPLPDPCFRLAVGYGSAALEVIGEEDSSFFTL